EVERGGVGGFGGGGFGGGGGRGLGGGGGGGRGGFGGGGRRGGFGGGRGGSGGPAPQPGLVLTPSVQEQLKLTADQKKKGETLQKDVDGKLAKLLTDKQNKQ